MLIKVYFKNYNLWDIVVLETVKMVKLTPDLIEQAIQYINPVRDRELLLRG